MAGQSFSGEKGELSSFLPRNHSLLILATVVGLALLAALETHIGIAARSSIDYSRWPDDFLAACGELSCVRMAALSSPLVTGCTVAGCGMLTLLLCEGYWDRLRGSWGLSPLAGFLPAGQSQQLNRIDEAFGNLLLGLALALVALDFIALLSGLPFLQLLQPLALTRYVAIPLWLLREWLPGRLRAELGRGRAAGNGVAVA